MFLEFQWNVYRLFGEQSIQQKNFKSREKQRTVQCQPHSNSNNWLQSNLKNSSKPSPCLHQGKIELHILFCDKGAFINDVTLPSVTPKYWDHIKQTKWLHRLQLMCSKSVKSVTDICAPQLPSCVWLMFKYLQFFGVWGIYHILYSNSITEKPHHYLRFYYKNIRFLRL